MTKLAISVLVVAACGSDSPMLPDAAAQCMPSASAPTYTMLYSRYFARGTPGHCADTSCHGGADYNIWLCGDNKDTCYTGMVSMASLINTTNPLASLIGDRSRSPLAWINPNGVMPLDAIAPFPEGRDAILAWIGACAPNN